jgi:hypothetical protein
VILQALARVLGGTGPPPPQGGGPLASGQQLDEGAIKMKPRQSDSRLGLSGNGLKWIAIFAMIINHIGWMMPETLPGMRFLPMFLGWLK